MKLYHFTPAHMLDGIMRDGLTLGAIPVMDLNGYIKGVYDPCQWLTEDGDFNAQSWATQNIVKYDRTAYRLKIAIPKARRDKLRRAWDFMVHQPDPMPRLVTDWEGSINWFIFFGRVPPGWIREVDKKPEMVVAI